MDKNDILNYVTETPGNTNRAVLGDMLDSFASDGGGGSNDLDTAIVTLVCDQSIIDQVVFYGAVCLESYSTQGLTDPIIFPVYTPVDMGMEMKVPLYKGSAIWATMGIPVSNISVTGDITVSANDSQSTMLIITGNGTITVSTE